MKKKEDIEFCMTGKLTPQNVDAEEMVLGAILINQNAFYEVSNIIRPEYFYKEKHQIIFESFCNIVEEGNPIDLLSVITNLKKQKLYEDVGGASYIAQLTSRIASSANIEYHSLLIKESYIKRLLIQKSSNIIKESYNDSDLINCLNNLETLNEDLSNVLTNNKEIKKISDISLKVNTQIEKRYDNFEKGIVTAVSSGLKLLDYHLYGGWQNSDLIILGGRPGMGKTAMMIKFVLSAAERGIPVAFFQLEMSSIKIIERFICSITTIEPRKIKTGELDNSEREEIKLAIEYLDKLPIYIDDSPNLTPQQLNIKCKRLKAKYKVGLIVVDYLQLLDMQTGANKQYKRHELVGETSRQLKITAKELDLPLIVGCQLNRASTARGNKEPDLGDLRESGTIEQDADIVIFPHRPAYYKEPDFEIIDHDGTFIKGNGFLIIAKYRDGGTDKISFSYNKSLTKICDWNEIDEVPFEFTKTIQQRIHTKIVSNSEFKEDINYVKTLPINNDFDIANNTNTNDLPF